MQQNVPGEHREAGPPDKARTRTGENTHTHTHTHTRTRVWRPPTCKGSGRRPHETALVHRPTNP